LPCRVIPCGVEDGPCLKKPNEISGALGAF
jgi:hypothetical protein